jgi:anti-sigma factor RsiW
MKPCSQLETVQSYLDRELDASAADRFRQHLAGCAQCAAELALYTRVFAALDDSPTWDPGEALTERVMDRVLPSRQRRRRWVQAAGWAYGTLLGASLAAFALWLFRPGTIGEISALSAAASHSLVRLTVFTLNAAAFAVLNVVNGWTALNAAGAHFAPFGRALTTLFANRAVGMALLPAALACAVVLRWMLRPRGRGTNGARHVGVLGF